MPVYRVDAVERFVMLTTYYVEAVTPEAAEKLARMGKVPYEDSEVADDQGEWVETQRVVEDEHKGPASEAAYCESCDARFPYDGGDPLLCPKCRED